MADERGNLFDRIPDSLPEELVEVLVATPTTRVERIVSQGHVTPADAWYDQDDDELVVVVQGAAELEIAGRDERVRLARGDWLLLPAHLRHRVTWTDPDGDTVWLAVFLSR